MNPVQYIILNKSAGMSTGKAAAQAAHASVEGLRLNAKQPWGNPWDASIVNRWYRGGHHAKIVLEADDLYVARDYLQARKFECALVIDEGRTEFDYVLTPTAIGCPVLDKDQPHVCETFSVFKLFTDARLETDAEAYDRIRRGHYGPQHKRPWWRREKGEWRALTCSQRP